MRLRRPNRGKFAKRVLPRTLLSRSLLIILLPLVLLQAVAMRIFYGNHLDIVSRRLSDAVVGEISYTLDEIKRFPDPKDQAWIILSARENFNLEMSFAPGTVLPMLKTENILGPMDDDLRLALRNRQLAPFTMDWTSNPSSVLIRVQLPQGVLTVEAPRKRLDTGTMYLFFSWLAGTSLIVFATAAFLMRNQLQAIRRLTLTAEALATGRDIGPIQPEGALELRKAATAFNRIRERVRRFLAQRTEMLVGVSHELRTPLTRLRLALAMMPAEGALREEVSEMTADVNEMERKISGYLALARSEGKPTAEMVAIAAVLEELAAGLCRTGLSVEVNAPAALVWTEQAEVVKRAVASLFDNGGRNVSRIALCATVPDSRSVIITVDDDRPGILPGNRESALFGYGGGDRTAVTVARDIVRAKGGELALGNSALGGLRAQIRLPVSPPV
ncbi:MAG: two-component sensor histidine kinase [Acetobacteraceae bacterium]|nr:two-component sensor histidine kinase [Acetobacteraceae bacterium]